MEARGRTSRAEWQKRIERWLDSGLTAEQFASELGVNVGTLRHWKYALSKREGGRSTRARHARPRPAADFVEVSAPAVAPHGAAFELEVSGRRLHIPAAFDESALARLLAVLERR
jgi:hypothetical protein